MDDLKLLAGAVLLYGAKTWGRGIIGVITPPWFHKPDEANTAVGADEQKNAVRPV